MKYLILILSLPTQNAAARMRIWRALKSCGSAALRDGVYALPDTGGSFAVFKSIQDEAAAGDGTAYVFQAEPPPDLELAGLFSRAAEFAALSARIARLRRELAEDQKDRALKQARKLRKELESLIAIDFFPEAPQQQVSHELADLDRSIARLGAPDEPAFMQGSIAALNLGDFQGRRWATRQRPWADRLASAWLIRRLIDPAAEILWLSAPQDCPADALGFDFDGAAFSHVGDCVTFEVLMRSFALETPALQRLAHIVHFLDIGGVQPAEAAGVEGVLQGLRSAISDDDQLLLLASHVFDGLLANFQRESA